MEEGSRPERRRFMSFLRSSPSFSRDLIDLSRLMVGLSEVSTLIVFTAGKGIRQGGQ